jgi:hypothetical protein
MIDVLTYILPFTPPAVILPLVILLHNINHNFITDLIRNQKRYE